MIHRTADTWALDVIDQIGASLDLLEHITSNEECWPLVVEHLLVNFWRFRIGSSTGPGESIGGSI